jgi:hypothetical protein
MTTKLTIAEENALPGAPPTEWSIDGAGDTTNLGFARPFSVDVGETVRFACDGSGTVLDVYRIGWYGGLGWCNKVKSLANTATSQPEPDAIPGSNGAVSCSNWTDTASWAVPDNMTPGLYVGVRRNVALNDASYIPFVVRDDSRPADIMVKISDATWALAYNYYGTPVKPLMGKSLYGSGGPLGEITLRAHAASYQRPIVTREGVRQTYWLNAEAPLIRYLERMGFDVTYSASRDWREGDDAPTLAPCEIHVSSGHDEYWSQGMRDKWEALRDAGKHLIFMSGNEVFWRTRLDPGGDTMWCYKDTMDGPGAHAAGAPLDPVTWTGTWKDTRWAERTPENLLTGTDFRLNGLNAIAMVIDAADTEASHPFWRHTPVAASGFTSGAGIIGFEADERLPTLPATAVTLLARTSFDAIDNYADDDGKGYTGSKTGFEWGIVSQRRPSGAVVVGFGTCQWAWGLDATHDRGADVSDPHIQQATYNLLRDLGAVPATPIAGLTAPSPVGLDAYGLTPASP